MKNFITKIKDDFLTKLLIVLTIIILITSIGIITVLLLVLQHNGHIVLGNDINFNHIANIGEFIGGVIGPLLSFLTIFLLILNYLFGIKKSEQDRVLNENNLKELSKQRELDLSKFNTTLDIQNNERAYQKWKDSLLLYFQRVSDLTINRDYFLRKGDSNVKYSGIAELRNDLYEALKMIIRFGKNKKTVKEKGLLVDVSEILHDMTNNFMNVCQLIYSCPLSDYQEKHKEIIKYYDLFRLYFTVEATEYVNLYHLLSKLGYIQSSELLKSVDKYLFHEILQLYAQRWELVEVWNELIDKEMAHSNV